MQWHAQGVTYRVPQQSLNKNFMVNRTGTEYNFAMKFYMCTSGFQKTYILLALKTKWFPVFTTFELCQKLIAAGGKVQYLMLRSVLTYPETRSVT